MNLYQKLFSIHRSFFHESLLPASGDFMYLFFLVVFSEVLWLILLRDPTQFPIHAHSIVLVRLKQPIFEAFKVHLLVTHPSNLHWFLSSWLPGPKNSMLWEQIIHMVYRTAESERIKMKASWQTAISGRDILLPKCGFQKESGDY